MARVPLNTQEFLTTVTSNTVVPAFLPPPTLYSLGFHEEVCLDTICYMYKHVSIMTDTHGQTRLQMSTDDVLALA